MKARWVHALVVILAVSLFFPLQSAFAAKKKKAKAKESPPAAETQAHAAQETKAAKEAGQPAAKEAKTKPATKAKAQPAARKEAKVPAAAPAASSATWPAAELTLGIQAREAETEGIGDLLIPVWNPGGKGLLFLNPRAAFTDDDAEEANLGIGYRQLLPKQKVILGANAYYDYRDTGYSHYDQWGLGVELLSTWVDARANYYKPDDKQTLVASETETSTRRSVSTSEEWEDPYAQDHVVLQDYVVRRTETTITTTRTFEQFEQALGGYDWEIGLRLPLPLKPETLEARIFGGYYDFDNDLGAEAKGWKARAELRLAATLFLDAGLYEDDRLTGSDWFAGARVSVPLDLAAIAKGRNPFAPAQSRLDRSPRDFSARLTEMVMRDPQIRLDVSKFLENPDLLTETSAKKSSTDRESYVLLADVQFVDGDATGPGDGTGQNPFPTIQQGAEAVFGSRIVYVHDAARPYVENVQLQPGTTLWGSGITIPGYGGKVFGSGIMPVVDGVSMGPSITMSDRTTVQGFMVRNTELGGPPILINIPCSPTPVDIRRVGIYGDNATDLTIAYNTLAHNEYGAALFRNGDFNLLFTDNVVRDNDKHGLGICALGASGTFNADIRNSIFAHNGWNGAYIGASTYDLSIVNVRNSAFTDNTDVGLLVEQDESVIAMAMVDGVNASGNGAVGIVVAQPASIVSLANISDSTANNNGTGIVLVQNSLFASVGLIGLADGVDRTVNALAGLAGFPLPAEVAMFFKPDGPVTASHNASDGVAAQITSSGLLALGGFFDITANNNGDNGVLATMLAPGFAVGLGGSSANWSEMFQLGDQIGNLFGLDLPLDIAGSGRFQANNNGEYGFFLQTIAQNAAVNAVVGVESVNNGFWGTAVESTSDGLAANALARIDTRENTLGGLSSTALGDNVGALSVLADIRAMNNEGGDGILSTVASPNGFAALLVMPTDTLRPAASVLGQEFLGAPITLPGAPFGPIVASGNASNGFTGVVNGNTGPLGIGALAALFDVQAENNGGDGINLQVHTVNGVSLAAILSSDLLYDEVPAIFGAPAIPHAGLGPVLAQGNGGNGISLTQNAQAGTYAALVGIEANGNLGGDGIHVEQTTAGGDAFALLLETDAANNGDEGIELAMTSSGAALSALSYVDVASNANQGVRVVQNSVSSDAMALLGGVDAMYNGAAGIRYDLTAANIAAAAITESESMYNGGAGANMILNAGGDVGLLVGTNALALLQASGWVGGPGAVALGLIADQIPQDEPEFNHNGAVGFRAELTSAYGNVLVDIDGANANNNTNHGFNLQLSAAAGGILGVMNNAWANDNGGNGINLDLAGSGIGAGFQLSHLRTVGNENNGINVVENYTGAFQLRGERIVAASNGANGVRLVASGLGGAPLLDFGGGGLGSPGQNSFYGNGNRDFRYNNGGGATVMARSNWWGVGGGTIAGNIDRSDPLGADPNAP